jgi:hypothetical protein
MLWIPPVFLDRLEPQAILFLVVYRRRGICIAGPVRAIVKHFNLIIDLLASLLAGWIDLSLYAFALEQLEGALRSGFVIAIAPPAHAAHQIVGTQEVLPVITAELATLVGMHHHGGPPDKSK